MAIHFNHKMATEEPGRLPHRFPWLCLSTFENPMITNVIVARLMRTARIRKTAGPDSVSSLLLENLVDEFMAPSGTFFIILLDRHLACL